MTKSDLRRRPTLLSLARELGVSRQTVSNVINAPHLVGQETRERVQAHIDRSGYRPSAIARALRTRRSYTVAIRLVPVPDGSRGEIMQRLLHATTESLEQYEYRPLLFTATNQREEIKTIQYLYDSAAIDAAILTRVDFGDQRPRRLQEAQVPFVTFGRPRYDGADYSWVDIDNTTGIVEAIRHLRRLGHEQIGFLGWKQAASTIERQVAWRQAMTSIAAHLDRSSLDRLDRTVRGGVHEGRQAMARLRENGATAVICSGDALTLGVVNDLQDNPISGFDPDHSIFGFDDSPITTALGLSSIVQPIERIASALVAFVIAEIDHQKGPYSLLLSSAAHPRSHDH